MGILAELKGAWRVWRDRGDSLADPKAHEVELAYTDAQGNRWYAFRDPETLPPERAISALVHVRRSDLNYTREDAAKWCADFIEACNEGNMVQAVYLARVMQDRLEWAAEEATLLDVAKCYYLLNDEQPGTMRQDVQDAKDAIWRADKECAAFFLREAFYLTHGFSELSLSDIPTYLAERRTKIRKGSKRKPSAGNGDRTTDTASPVR